MPEIKASFLMTAHNAGDTIKEAVQSVLKQSERNFELVIVDDASEDDTISCIKSFDDSRIRLIRNKKNLHIAGAANAGMAQVKTEYILRLDADDIAHPERLKKQLVFMGKNPEVGVCGSYTEYFGDKQTIWKMPVENEAIKARLIWDNCFANSSVIIRRKVLEENKLTYTDAYKYPPMEDYEMWLKLLGKTNFANLPEVLCYKRDSNVSQSALYKEDKLKQMHKLYAWFFDSIGLPASYDELNAHLLLHEKKNIITSRKIKDFYLWQKKLLNHFIGLENLFPLNSLQKVHEYKWRKLAVLLQPNNFRLYKDYIQYSLQGWLQAMVSLLKK